MTDPETSVPLARRALIALSIRIASAGVAYLSQILLARWLGLEQYGTFAAAWAWLLIAAGTLPLGLNVTVIARLPHYLAGGEIALWRGLALASIVVTATLSLAVAAAGLAIVAVVPALASNPLATLAMLGLVCLPLLALSEINEGIARAHGWIGSALMPSYLVRPLVMLGLGGIIVARGGGLDAATAMGCAIAACAVTALAQSTWLGWRLGAMRPGRQVRFAVWGWLAMSLPMLVTEICEMLLFNLDLFVVAAVLGSENAGIYIAAQRTIALVAFVNFAVGAATANAVAAEVRAADRAALQRQLRLATTLAFWPSLAGAIVLVGLSPLLLSLFGDAFVAGTPLVAILAVGFVARSAVGPADLLFNVLGAQRACAWILAGNLLACAALHAVLVPAFGITGAAAATTLGMICLSISFLLHARLRLGLDLLPGSPLAAMVMIGALPLRALRRA